MDWLTRQEIYHPRRLIGSGKRGLSALKRRLQRRVLRLKGEHWRPTTESRDEDDDAGPGYVPDRARLFNGTVKKGHGLEYRKEIYDEIRAVEKVPRPWLSKSLLPARKTAIVRVMVHSRKHNFSSRSIYFSVSVADKYLSTHRVKTAMEVEEIFMTTLYMGAKMEEVYFPCYAIFLEGTGLAAERMLSLETSILVSMDFRLAGYGGGTVEIFDLLAAGMGLEPKAYAFAQYASEIILCTRDNHCEIVGILPSLIAAALLYLVTRLFKCKEYRPKCTHSGYDGKVLASTARAIVSALQAYWNEVDGRVGGVKHRQTTLSEHWQSSQSSSLLSSVIQSKFEGEIYMHIGEYRILHGIK